MHSKKKPIQPFPKCKCGNISMFDITEAYVRIQIAWPFVGHATLENWQEAIYSQIRTNGKPTVLLENPNPTKVESFDFDAYQESKSLKSN